MHEHIKVVLSRKSHQIIPRKNIFSKKMKIVNQSPLTEFNQDFVIPFSILLLCTIAVLVITRQKSETQPSRVSKSTLCCFGTENFDDTEVLQRTYPGSSLSRQSRYSDEEFYINHASQTRSIVILDHIENCTFVYV